jgi:hypothetical protein
MRALGATSVVTVAQLERFLRVAQSIAEPESPQLANFLTAIQYFIEAFGAARSGYRLTFIARPPLLFYGLYGIGGPDLPTEHLLDLVMQRGRFAAALDCYCCCACEEDAAKILVVGGKALFDIDRAIDLLAQGSDKLGDGEAELRAGAFGLVVQAARDSIASLAGGQSVTALTAPLDAIINGGLLVPTNADTAWFGDPDEAARRGEVIHSMLCLQHAAEDRWLDLLRSMSAECRHEILLGGPNGVPAPVVTTLLDEAETLLEGLSKLEFEPCGELEISIPDHADVSLEAINHNIPFKGRGRNKFKKST